MTRYRNGDRPDHMSSVLAKTPSPVPELEVYVVTFSLFLALVWFSSLFVIFLIISLFLSVLLLRDSF